MFFCEKIRPQIPQIPKTQLRVDVRSRTYGMAGKTVRTWQTHKVALKVSTPKSRIGFLECGNILLHPDHLRCRSDILSLQYREVGHSSECQDRTGSNIPPSSPGVRVKSARMPVWAILKPSPSSPYYPRELGELPHLRSPATTHPYPPPSHFLHQ
jgi:hypothetical protein